MKSEEGVYVFINGLQIKYSYGMKSEVLGNIIGRHLQRANLLTRGIKLKENVSFLEFFYVLNNLDIHDMNPNVRTDYYNIYNESDSIYAEEFF